MATGRRSSANFISYDLRPAKQSERRILLEQLKIAGDCNLPIRDYRYVGMGANRFYDYLLIHKYIGIGNMVSLEHDPVMHKRAEFNCPYGFIQVLPQSTTGFIAADSFEAPVIMWLDYDGGLNPQVVADIAAAAAKLKVGDFFYVTAYGGPPKALEKAADDARLVWLQDTFGDAASGVQVADVVDAEFPVAVHKVLSAAFVNSFAYRTDGRFVLLMQVEYSDSKPMVTVGGGFLADGFATTLHAKLRAAQPFLKFGGNDLYQIRSFHLTEKERVLFDFAVTHRTKRTKQRNALKGLGFRDAELSAYAELIRYLPRYVETMV
jgi:hypothetical protein